MPEHRTDARPRVTRPAFALALAVVLATAGPISGRGPDPFDGFELPDAWEEEFWSQPGVEALRTLEPEALAALAPAQAGLRFCRCPGCDAPESEDPLSWSPESPELLTCRRCGITLPNDRIPAKASDGPSKGKIPEEVVEVLPGVEHTYPYHAVEPTRQAYPDERIYLAAKRDYEAREFLAKAALYAAVRYHEQPADGKDPALARLAGTLLLRFAQVYPAYAVHYDQPGQPKYFEGANQGPPYRRAFRSGKWDWLGCLDVPLNLVVAYALLRDEPAFVEAGRALGDPDPRRTIEVRLFRASAAFVRAQVAAVDDRDGGREEALLACRGLLAVGRLLDDPSMTASALARLETFFRLGFYHDGLWCQGDPSAHRRVVALLDDWFVRLLEGVGKEIPPMLALARSAGQAALTDPVEDEVRLAAWPTPIGRDPAPRGPALLGGAGLARLAIGQGADSLDLELRGLGDLAAQRSDRLALRLAVGGRPALADLDDLPPMANGWDRSSASHNLVLVDGLNQRETPVAAREPAPGSDILFFAADPDFQVATFDDRHAYPESAGRYRRTIVAVAGQRARYAVDIFEAEGGLQHDLLVHGPVDLPARWRPSVAIERGPDSLLPPTIAYLPRAPAEDGRWFVQAIGALDDLRQSPVDRPFQVALDGPSSPLLRLHLLGGLPATVVVGASPDPEASPEEVDAGRDAPRAALVLRRRSIDGSGLASTFVSLIEPAGSAAPLGRVGRVESPAGTVVLFVETADGPEHLVINLNPGVSQTVRLIDGRPLTTDGLAVRAAADALILAGGTSAEASGLRVRQEIAAGTLRLAARHPTPGARGYFETDGPIPRPEALAGRILIVRHGDGSSRGWTLARVETTPDGRARLHVREEPGFQIDPETGEARYYQFPSTTAPGPHQFRVSRIARST